MKALEALKVTINAVQVDSTLSGEPVNLNRLTFWLSELSYGRKWFADSLSMAGRNDIVRTAAQVVCNAFTPVELLRVIEDATAKETALRTLQTV